MKGVESVASGTKLILFVLLSATMILQGAPMVRMEMRERNTLADAGTVSRVQETASYAPLVNESDIGSAPEMTTGAEEEVLTDSGLNYVETTQEVVNPERGFYQALSATLPVTSSGAIWTADRLKTYTEDFGILHLRFGLDAFSSNGALAVANGRVISYGKDAPISESSLNALRSTFEQVRKAGGSAIIRFSYNVNGYSELTDDGKRYVQAEPAAGLSLVESHIAQLGTVIRDFPDVIASVETGMFGPWGEQHSTAMADKSNQENYYRLGEAWLKAVSEGKSISFRRPLYFIFWANMRYQLNLTESSIGDSVDEINAVGGDILRVGCYNDGYLGSQTDLGTFDAGNRASVTKWLSSQAKRTFYGGEAVVDSSTGLLGAYNTVDYLSREGFETHTSYLNIDWNDKLIDAWRGVTYKGSDSVYSGKESGFTYIANRLGYRLVLRQSELTAQVVQGGVLSFRGEVENVGFGNVVNPQTARVLLVSESSESSYDAEVSLSVNEIDSGEKERYAYRFRVPSVAEAGDYRLYLKFSGVHESASSEARSIRFANVNGVFEHGANLIGKLTVTADADAGYYPSFEEVEYIGTRQIDVTFLGGDGAEGIAPEQMVVKEGSHVTLPHNTFVKAHYAFLSWSDGERAYAEGAIYKTGDRNVTFTALWKSTSHIVQFHGNGGTLQSGEALQTVAHGQSAVAPVYTKEGYAFDGWSGTFSVVECDLVITAKWRLLTQNEASDDKGCSAEIATASGAVGALVLTALSMAIVWIATLFKKGTNNRRQ